MALIRREEVWALVGDRVMTVRPGSKLEWVIRSYAYAIDGASEVDAAPVVHGRWIEIEDSCGDCHYQCTECGEEWNLDAGTPAENNMNYCPNCGAKMDGKRRDDDAAD